MTKRRPRPCFIATDPNTLDDTLTAAVASGDLTEHDATAVREFAEFLRAKAAALRIEPSVGLSNEVPPADEIPGSG